VDRFVFYVFDNADSMISYLVEFLLISCLINWLINIIVNEY
jgi:hypothetical protein